MTSKHQSECYRTFGNVRWRNFCDILSAEHETQVSEAKKKGARIKLRKHPSGYTQAFIHPDDEARA